MLSLRSVCSSAMAVVAATTPSERIWMLLGVRIEMFDVFVATDLQLDGDVLWAHSSAMDSETTIPTARGMLLCMLRWRCLSKTHGAGIGPSARMFTMAEAGGVQALWRMAMDDPHVSSYHLGGYIRIGEREKDIIAVACFSAYIGEQFILDLFSDDRLLRWSDEYLVQPDGRGAVRREGFAAVLLHPSLEHVGLEYRL